MEKLYIDESIIDNLPSVVKEELMRMPKDRQLLFVEEYERRKKSSAMAYFFLLICLGAPYGYLGKWGWQLLYWITGFGAFLWFLILLFTLPSMVHDYNRDVAMDIMKDLKIMGVGQIRSHELEKHDDAAISEPADRPYSNVRKPGNDVTSFSEEKINEIIANEAIYNPKLVAACREEQQLRIESEKFTEYAESKTDDELVDILENPDQYNPAMVRRCEDVLNVRMEKAEEERKLQEAERLRLEEEERERRAREAEERLAEEKRREELWKKWRVPAFCILAAVVLGISAVVAYQHKKEQERLEQLRIEELNARRAAKERAEARLMEEVKRRTEEREEQERIAQLNAVEEERLMEEKKIAAEKTEAERLEKERIAAEERAARLAAEEKVREDWKQQILAKHKSGKYSIGEPMPEITGYATVPIIFNIENRYVECFIVINDKCSLKDARAYLNKCPDSLQAKAIGLKIATINANLLKLGYKTIGNSYWVNSSSNNPMYANAYDSHTQKVIPFYKEDAVNTCLQVIKYNK